jgi:hypothetical protein
MYDDFYEDIKLNVKYCIFKQTNEVAKIGVSQANCQEDIDPQ